MPGDFKLDLSAIVTGVAAYVAIAGWMIILPVFGFVISSLLGGGPGDLDAESIARQFVAVAMYFACGYFTGRASQQSPVYNAAILGVVLFLLVSFSIGCSGRCSTWRSLSISPMRLRGWRGRFWRPWWGNAAEWQIRTRGAGWSDSTTFAPNADDAVRCCDCAILRSWR
jgi:hypothetical protein